MSREVPQDVDEAFFAGRRSAAVPFVINDEVQVSCGPHEGMSGAVISIEATRPTMRVLVEAGDGTEVVVDASALTLVTR